MKNTMDNLMENTDTKKTLFILDSYGLIYRAYFAFVNRPLTDKNGRNISAVHGFFNNLALTIKNFKPDMFAVALDSKTPTFRHKEYPEYKATRPTTPDDLKAQFPLIEEVLTSLKIKSIRSEGFEADDVIATLSTKAKNEGYKVFVLSGDKDLLQLVSDDVRILRAGKKDKSKMWEEVGREGVVEEWGVQPEQICDVLSLTGDTADNVPGVKGVGEKTAVKFINQYGSVEELYKHADEIKGAIGQKVRADKDNAFFSKKLISLVYDVPLGEDFSFEDLSVDKCDYSSAAETLKKMSLVKVSGLFNDLSSNSSENVSDIQENKGEYKSITDKDELSKYIDEAIKSKIIAFDTETDGLDVRTANIVGFSLSYEKGKGVYIPLLTTDTLNFSNFIQKKDAFDSLKKLFDSEVTIVMHNAKFDLKILFYNGFFSEKPTTAKVRKSQFDEFGMQDMFADFDSFSEKKSDEENDESNFENDVERFDEFFNSKAKIFDTMIAAWVLDSNKSIFEYSLESLSEKKLQLKGIEFDSVVESGKTFADVPLDIATKYSAEDSDFTLQLYQCLFDELNDAKLFNVFETEMQILPILAKMEISGVHLETSVLKDYETVLNDSLKTLQEKIFELAGHKFNISSPKQLGTVLFEEMGLEGKKKTKSGTYSTDEESLKSLEGNEFVDKVLDFRGKAKLLSTYVEALPLLVDENSRIHTSFIQTGTATGRLSSRDPNLQNIPIREEEGRHIRNAFTATNGKVLISADYAQIELVVLAHLSGDENLCNAFNEGVDVHKSTASLIYGVPMEEVSAEQRRNAKTFNFGIMYGMGAFRLSKDLKISYREADNFIKSYFEVYSGVKKFLDNTIENAQQTGFITTISGRKRQIKNIDSSSSVLRESAIRIAKNSPIQGSAADIVKKAMLDIDSSLKELNNGTKLLLQVHDELIFECNDDEETISNTVALIKDKMEHAFRLNVPLRVSVEVGKNWGEFH